MVVQSFMKMLIFILLCVVHGEQLMEKSPKGPRERNTTLPIQLGKVSSLENTINIEVLGYLIGAGENEDQPIIVKRENAVEFKLSKEKVIFGDIPETLKDGF